MAAITRFFLVIIVFALTAACGGVVRDDAYFRDLNATGGAPASSSSSSTAGSAGALPEEDVQDFDYCVRMSDGRWVETECQGWCFANYSDAGLYANDFCFTSSAACDSYRENVVQQLGDSVSECVEL